MLDWKLFMDNCKAHLTQYIDETVTFFQLMTDGLACPITVCIIEWPQVQCTV